MEGWRSSKDGSPNAKGLERQNEKIIKAHVMYIKLSAVLRNQCLSRAIVRNGSD